MSLLTWPVGRRGRHRGRVAGVGGLLPLPSHQLTGRRSRHFSRHRAYGFWVSGVAVLAVLAVGAGHVALNQIRTI